MDSSRYIVQVFVGALSPQYEALSIEASKQTTSEEIVACICERLKLRQPDNFELAEVIGNSGGQECKERRLGNMEKPVAVQMLWPKYLPSSTVVKASPYGGHCSVTAAAGEFQSPEYRFCLREKFTESSSEAGLWLEGTDPQLIRDYFFRFLYQPKDKEYPDLCQLPDLNETSLLENLQARFHNGHIYTYVGSILIALNPFKFYPIYNPKYVNLYQNRRLGELPPHIFAVADAAYHTMLREKKNQCIVISGESGSGKTESTNLLLHHLTALSQKGTYGSGVEQTILSAGPVLEAFGNAKTAHNNNSSRFGKFIQVNYKENGMVHGAVVQKYLLEKSRIVSQAKKERNYHVFYYLLAGANDEERATLQLRRPQEYHYLNQSGSYTLEGLDEVYEFTRLKQSMEMVGFSEQRQKRLFAVLSAVLLLGNIEFAKKSTYHHDEAVLVKNPDVVTIISSLLKVKEETLMSALTTKKAKISGEILVINYKLQEAQAARDALAKCLYGALFDWIVLQLNHALLSKKDAKEHSGQSIGVLDIFGFEDFGIQNSFEQFCINFANEHLQYYFNQHVFKYEQEEYKREVIKWKIIDFMDNTGCLNLIEGKPNGLLCILDDQCNFPGATNETLLQKFNSEHKDNEFYEVPQRRDHGFAIKHYAGKVKYNVKDFREKNLDLMRQDIVSVLKNSSMVFVRELVGGDPVAVFRWAILRAFIRAAYAFRQAGQRHKEQASRPVQKNQVYRWRKPNPSENIPNNLGKNGGRRQSGSRRPFTDVHNNQVDGETNCENGLIEDSLNSNLQKLDGLLDADDALAMERANKILQRNKNGRPRGRYFKALKNLQSVKTLAGKTQASAPTRGLRKQPPTVSAQFQHSLILLMDTLNDASPFFVRCIKSNADKVPNKFDEDIVLRQLRYTGMLETVRIRQSGYNVRLTFDEFIQVYRILLPKGLLSSQSDVRNFLLTLNLNRDNYQIGKTKVFLRESEKMKLDLRLHQGILDRIVRIQRWYRVILERRTFLRLRSVVLGLQSHARRFLTQKYFTQLKEQWLAAVKIQACWRGYHERKKYQLLRRGVVFVQSCVRGFCARVRFKELSDERERIREQQRLMVLKRIEQADLPDHPSSQHDEAFASKESSQEELENDRLYGIEHLAVPKEHRDSEESSGIQEDSEAESMASEPFHRQPVPPVELSPPISPVSAQESLSPTSDVIFECQEPPKLMPRQSISDLTPRTPQNIADDYVKKPVKKLSIKRSKSARTTNGNDTSSYVHKNKMYKSPTKVPSITDLAKEQDQVNRAKNEELLTNRNPFHRAKKHFKGAMELLGKKKTHLNEDESDESGCEDSAVVSRRTPADTPEQSPVEPESVVNKFESFPLPTPTPPLRSLEQALSISTYTPVSSQQSPHNFKQINRVSKTDVCLACDKTMVTTIFGNNGYRCTECNLLSHPRCVQQANKWTCGQHKPTRRPTITRIDLPPSGKWNVTRTMEYSDRTDQVISDAMELRNMDEFITKKICQMKEAGGKHRDTIADVVFKRALKEFKAHLISAYSVAGRKGQLCIKYRDLITTFENTMDNICRQEQSSASFPVTMGVNAFRGFLNEFVSLQRTEERPKTKSKKEKRKKVEQVMHHCGHQFVLVAVNIPTVCEVCQSFMWLMERSLVCQKCKFTCHKKCCNKVSTSCRNDMDVSPQGGRLFGVRIQNLLTDDLKVPAVVDRLISTIEMKGLYTEGIYRKAGACTKVKQLRKELENGLETVDFDEYPVHVLCTVLKAFFRDMPEPLLTFDAYDELIRATDISDYNEKVSTLFDVIDNLPKPNHNLIERLIFHLARVAQHKDSNLMSSSSLAIVFAPCILRTNKCLNAQDSLNDIAKQTVCIEHIIDEQLKKLKSTIADIDTLDMVCHKASSRLSSLRSLKAPLQDNAKYQEEAVAPGVEEDILSRQIESLKNEKTLLTTELPTLKRTCSDDDILSLDMGSSVSSIDDVPHSQHEEYAVTFDLPVSPSSLQHLTKNRVVPPANRRLPSKFVSGNAKRVQVCVALNGQSVSPADSSILSMYHPLDANAYKDEAIMV